MDKKLESVLIARISRCVKAIEEEENITTKRIYLKTLSGFIDTLLTYYKREG